MNERLAIIDGVRTPFCRMGTDLASLSADDLGRCAVDALLTRTGFDPGLVDEVIFGCVGQPAEAMNIARVIALRAGLPEKIPAMTVHRNCASGFEAITLAQERLASGHGSVFIVGGTESMSQMPLLFSQPAARKLTQVARARSALKKAASMLALRPADFHPRVGLQLGLTDPVCGLNMGDTAELLAREYHISRADQDAFALRSHQRAIGAHERLQEEICPVYLTEHGGRAITGDNGPREKVSLESLGKLPPVFDRRYGTVSAGNSSQLTDGAVALLVMGEARAHLLGLTPLGFLGTYAYTGCDPAHMGLGPVSAIKATKRPVEAAEVVEINEAFAAQTLAVLEKLGRVEDQRLNVNGGAIALGHPVGATGARLVLTALKELKRRGGQRALVSACVGGGQGAALWLEHDL
ncbi:MAG: thiolase family protein [Chthoniobacteraceae bacterium]